MILGDENEHQTIEGISAEITYNSDCRKTMRNPSKNRPFPFSQNWIEQYFSVGKLVLFDLLPLYAQIIGIVSWGERRSSNMVQLIRKQFG